MQKENNPTNETFVNHLHQIANVQTSDLPYFEDLRTKFPYCQITAALAAKAAIGTPIFETYLQNASVISNNRGVLYHIIHSPENLLSIPKKNNLDIKFDLPVAEILDEVALPTDESASILEEEIVETKDIENEESQIQEFTTSSSDAIDNSSFDQNSIVETEITPHHQHKVDKEVIDIETYDYREPDLVFEPVGANINTEIPIEVESVSNEMHADATEISNYHDEKMPYSFLWWLDKTRKEFDQNYQPYAQTKVSNKKSDEKLDTLLNHQITEHILHQGTFDEYKNKETESPVVSKEDKIIFKFITEEPQIKPLPSNKIDIENKAQKSSSDNYDLVSETLAKIYVEQMLYAKALDAYKKLSLKYPEKSTYFASQIKYLELKVN